jgi:predicted anti-sigma-YlaC factor YlaD
MSGACSRAREWASLRLDGEISEFETMLLRAHLIRCVDCRSFAEDTAVLTEHVRRTPPERMTHPVAVIRRRPRRRRPAALAATALAFASVSGAFFVNEITGGGSAVPTVFSGDTGTPSDIARMRILRSDQLRPSSAGEHRMRGLQV